MRSLFVFRGKVREGAKRGRLLGFPTANIALQQKIPEGIYASRVIIAGKTNLAATFIGAAKTFGEKDYKAESYILDFDKNIYGKWISIKLFKKIRGNQTFASQEDLITQMKKDIAAIRIFFSENPS